MPTLPTSFHSNLNVSGDSAAPAANTSRVSHSALRYSACFSAFFALVACGTGGGGEDSVTHMPPLPNDAQKMESKMTKNNVESADTPEVSYKLPILGIDHVVLRVANLQVMLDFYVGVLGCKIERERPDLGLTQLRAGHALIDLLTVDGAVGREGGPPPRRDGHNMDHLCLLVGPFDADKVQAHLKRHGVDVSEPQERYGAEGFGPSVYLMDPEGNHLELKAR